MADNPFVPIPLQNYNANPPPNDGTEVPENVIDWDTIKVKLTDPTATIWDSLNANISAAFLKTINTDPDQNNLVQGSIAYAPSALTVATGVITPTRRHHTLITEGGGPTDSIQTILPDNVSDGAEIILRLDTTGQTITFEVGQGGTGEIFTPSGQNVVLSDVAQSVQFQRRGLAWYQIAAPGLSVLSAEFSSAEQSIVSGTTVTIPHGLGSAPKILRLFLVNKVADSGWSPTDPPIEIAWTQTFGGTSLSFGATLYSDETNVYLLYGAGQSGSTFEIHRKTDGVRANTTDTSWRCVVTAYA